jgi:hypothetical protein
MLGLWALCSLIPQAVHAQSDGLPRGCYQMPYTRYESENATTGGGAVLRSAPQFKQTEIASEASNQKYVALPANGAFVAWSITNGGDGITLRFTIPDASDGSGQNGSLSVFVNDTKVTTVKLSSYYAYQYFVLYDQDPKNTPASRTFMRFDEVHFKLSARLKAGDKLKIQKDNGDGLEYGVDFIEVENVPAARTKPDGYLSVTDFGAVADDDKDDKAAFDACLAAADEKNTGVYIPAGTFKIDSCLRINVSDIGIQGAGIWHTNIYFSRNEFFSGGILSGNGTTNVDISNMYIGTANNLRWVNGVYRVYKCFMGVYGANSRIHDIWQEHFECGLWIGGYDDQPIKITDSLVVSHCRIRNNYADGCNFSQGTANSVLEHCSLRNNGDDAMASWPAKDMGNTAECKNLVFRFNTVENNWRAGGCGIFGGQNHQIHHCVIKDGVGGSAVRFTTEYQGFYFENNTEMRVYEMSISGCGTSTDMFDQEKGAIELYGADAAVKNISFENIDVRNSQRHAIQIGGNHAVDNIYFSGINIDGSGLDAETKSVFTAPGGGYGVMVFAHAGSATFNRTSFVNIEMKPDYLQTNDAYVLKFTDTDVALSAPGISLTPAALNLGIGGQAQLSTSFTPVHASDKRLAWSCTAPDVAVIDTITLTVTGRKTGSATISARSADGGFTATCAVTVGTQVAVAPVNTRRSGPARFAAFPNPARRFITVAASGFGEKERLTIRIYDARGAEIRVERADADQAGGLRHALAMPLVPGVYSLRITGAGRTVHTIVVKQ